jgi:hypothetical protein
MFVASLFPNVFVSTKGTTIQMDSIGRRTRYRQHFILVGWKNDFSNT